MKSSDSVLASKSRYCHHFGVVGGGIVVGNNFISVNLIKLHLLDHHHKGYNLTKNHNSARLFDICPFIDMQKWT